MDIPRFFRYNEEKTSLSTEVIPLKIQQKRDLLVNVAYWALIAAAVYLGFEYLLPICIPFLLGIPIAYLVVRISRKVHCTHRLFRIFLIVAIYGLIGLMISLAAVKAVSTISSIIKWLPEVYELKLLPLASLVYEWFGQTLELLDPALISALDMLGDSLISGLKNLVSYLSGMAVDLISGVATGIPSLILSLLAMIFSTVFVANDYERIRAFSSEHLPQKVKHFLKMIWVYLTDTLFVVIRSYILIMLLTFTELSILFSIFGIEHAVLKAALIAMLDILPILGTGGIMIPWAVISLVLGYTKLGIQLFAIYGIVTVVRNYVEPRIVGAQLGLHPIITLVSMFIGLRLFGFLGMFGLPISISFLWKQRKEKEAQSA